MAGLREVGEQAMASDATATCRGCLGLVQLVTALVAVLAIAGPAYADDWGPKRDPFDRNVIARYQAILAKDPYDPALAQLAGMYQRFRTIEVLVEELDAKGDGGSLVIAGRLLEEAKDQRAALATYQRAWALRPDDPKLALRIATLERTPDPERAREAYERALASADKTVQREAIRGLLELAHARRDRVAEAFHSKALAALEPRDATVQLEHGDAMFALDLIDSATEAYALAEKLAATDPVRRVEAIARRGRALEKRDRLAAEAEYRRAMAQLPRDHYLRIELFGRLVELHRSGGTLGALLAISLDEWPVTSRGAFEWYELAKLYRAVGDQPHAIAALEQVVKRSAEPKLHLELVDAYPQARAFEALAILDKLAARSGKDLGVLISIAERYARNGYPALALATYDKLLRLDPAAVDRMLDLVEDSFRTGKQAAAIALTKSVVPKLRTAEAHGRLGQILLEWGHFKGSVTELDRAIALASPVASDAWGTMRVTKAPQVASQPATLAAYYRTRAAAHDALRNIDAAVADGEKVLELAGDDPKLRRTARKELVRIVLHASGETGERAVFVEAWRVAFDFTPPEIEAGFLLLDYYGTSPCDHFVATRRPCDGEVARIVRKLSKLAEIDPDDVLLIATAYSAAGRHDEAIQILQTLRAVAPAREPDILARILKINRWRARFNSPSGWPADGEHVPDPEREITAHVRRYRQIREAIETPLRLGLRFGFGEGLRGGGEHMGSIGVMASSRLGADTFFTFRLDLADRGGGTAFHSFGGAVGVAKALVSTRTTALVLGFGERLERRWGDQMTTAYGPIGLSGEATLEVVGRTLPASFGMRLEQGMSDDARHTALLFEAALELR